MEIITSLENKRIIKYSKLLKKKYRDESDIYFIEGEHLVEEAFKTNNLVEVIETPEYGRHFDVPTTYVTYEVIKKLSNNQTPQPVIGLAKKLKERPISGKVLLLDNISDPGNLGTIIRSSVAFNVDTIVLSPDSVDLYNDKVLRSTEGMLYKINIVRRDLLSVINYLHQNNYQVLGTSVTNGENIKNISKNQSIALVMGNEGQGIKKTISSKCDKFIYIKMNPACESLNVGVATSIILYELGG